MDFWGVISIAFFLWLWGQSGDEDCPQHGDCTCDDYDYNE